MFKNKTIKLFLILGVILFSLVGVVGCSNSTGGNIDFTFNDVKKDSIKGTMYERISIFLIESVKKIVKEGLHTAQIWFSDTVKASMYGFEKLKYDEEYMKSILLNEKNEEESLILSKKITSVYYGILIRWCITNGDDNPNKLIKDFVDKDLKRMIGG